MTNPINDFQDILDAMERNPALRDALRRVILTDELLQVPVQLERIGGDINTLKEGQTRLEGDINTLKEGQTRLEGDINTLKEGQTRLEQDVNTLKEGQTRLEGDINTLKEGQTRLEQDVNTLKEGQTRLEQDVNTLKEGQTRLEGDVNTLKEGQTRLEQRVDRIGGDVSRLMGRDYESHVFTHIRRFLRRESGLNATVFSTEQNRLPLIMLLDQAETQGLITPQETDELVRTDLILTVDDSGDYILAEVSITVQHDDINRAAARAAILSKATARNVTPFAIGAREEPGIHHGNVQVLLIPEPMDP